MDHSSNPKENGTHAPSNHHEHMVKNFRKKFIVSAIVTLPILALSPVFGDLVGLQTDIPGKTWILFTLSSFIFLYGGLPFLKGMLKELRERQPAMMTLIALALCVSYIYSTAVVFGLDGKYFFWELATLIDIMLLGHWIEMKSVMRASKATKKLAALLPDTAHRISGNETEDIPVSDIKKGDRLRIKAGEKIPADARVINKGGFVDESMLTGETKPAGKNRDDSITGGSVNGDSIIEAEVTEEQENSYLNKVINLVDKTLEAKSKTQKFADKAAAWLTLTAITAGTVTVAAWLISGAELSFAIERMATVMVITCPHALGLAVPLVSAFSTTITAQSGILTRNPTAFENARKISMVMFDKTGTLTEGKFKVSSIKSLNDDYSDNDLLQIAASLEKHSEHSIASAIVRESDKLETDKITVNNAVIMKGEGIKGKVEDKDIMAVSRKYLEKNDIEIPGDFDKKSETVVYVVINKKPAGIITLSDNIKPESFKAIKELRNSGIKCRMITGDNHKAAEAVSGELGLDGFSAQVLPEDKLQIIKDFQNKGEYVAMTGDGINDAPALAQADIGIAIGSGTDIAAETADIILVDSNPVGVSRTIIFGKAVYKKILQNLFWASGYNIIAIPLAAGVLYNKGILLSPAFGAVLMSLSTIIVALNATLLKKEKAAA